MGSAHPTNFVVYKGSGYMPSISNEKKLRRRLKILSDVLLLSPKAFNHQSVLQMVTKLFKTFTEADASVLMLNINGSLTPASSLGIPFDRVKEASLPSSTGLKKILTRPPIDVHFASFLNIPLVHNQKLIGLSAVFSATPKRFHPFEQDKGEGSLLDVLAGYVAASIENIALANTLKTIERFKRDWENIFDSIDDLISIQDTSFTVVRANMAVARKFNMNIREVIGKKCFKIFHGTDVPPAVCPCCKSVETKTKYTMDSEEPHTEGIFNVTTFPLFDDGGKFIGTIRVARDVTEHKKLWNHLIQSEKMSALGLLVAGIAHEINNPLSVILGYSQSLLKKTSEKDRFELEKICKNAKRAANTVRHLLDFARCENTAPQHVDVHHAIEEAVSLFVHELNIHSVRLVKEYTPLPLIVNGDANQIQQVFVNMISNALDAMRHQKGEKALSIKTKGNAKQGKVVFQDTGCGISDKDIKRIFDPFFTTKEVGKGTGLGLSICYRIIQNHGGNIQVSSQSGKGSTFTIELPMAKT